MTFKPQFCVQHFAIEDLQEKCNQFIDENLPCQITMRDDGHREVGFGELRPYPCGGTHVASLRQINGLKIQAIQEKKGKLSVQYDIEL